jgi:NAD(P)-dependent dehydrogenase (short-subunit alcohol dehydrogenase family)
MRGRRVVVTGVGRAGQVGEVVAAAFAEAGAVVHLVDRDPAVHDRAADLRAGDATVTSHEADLTDPVAVAAVADAVRAAGDGGIAALAHVAGGFAFPGPVAETDPALWHRMFAINAHAAFVTVRGFLPLLRAGRGALACVGSVAAAPGGSPANVAAYAAAKAALATLVRAVAVEEAAHGVRANLVTPVAVRTAQNLAEMGADQRYVEREEVARTIRWLCSDDAARITGEELVLR